jgi:hypothetical protein
MATTSTERVSLQKSKLLEKLATIDDKKEIEEEIGGQTGRWQWNRTLSGLNANKQHLETAKEVLDDYRTNSIEALLKPALTKRDRLIADAHAEYNQAVEKLKKKTSEHEKLLVARVKRFTDAVKLSEENLALLQTNKPKGLIRVEGTAKKVERELEFITGVEEMNKKQEEYRAAYLSGKVAAPDISNMPQWLVECGEDPSLKEMRKDAEREVNERKRKEDEEYERKKEAAAKERRLMLAAEEQRLTNARQKELSDKGLALVEDEIFRLHAEEDARKKKEEDARQLEEFRKRDAEEEQRYREQNQSDSESEDEETLQRETAAALKRQQEMIERHAPVQKMDRYQPESQGFPPTITNTKLKKPIKSVRR